jgi:DNA-binding protein HU-beta
MKGGAFIMNKGSLVDYVAGKTGMTKKAAQDAIEAVMQAVMETVSKGDSVTLTGFGTFRASKREARNGRNPQTGAVIKIPARTVPVFRAGKEFKDKVK